MLSLTASFVDVLDQSVNFTHLCARHYVVNVLVPALAKLAAQLVADLLIAAGPPAATLLIGQFLRAHAHAQHLPDLEARCRLSLWRTAQRLAKPLEQQHARLCEQPCTASPCSEGCLRSHAAIHAHPRSTRTPRTCPRPYSAYVPRRRPGWRTKQPFASKQGLILLTWGWRTAQGPYLGRVHARLKDVIRIPCHSID